MSPLSANLLLLLTAAIWGTAFVPQYLGMNYLGPFAFTGIRFFLGALCIVPFAWFEWRRLQRSHVIIDRTDCLHWLGIGLLITLAALLQQIGIPETTVTNASFITALYVPIVPLLIWLVDRKAPPYYVFVANSVAIVGVYLLSGGGFSALTVGDYWVFASSFFWAAHVLALSRVVCKKGAPILLATFQFLVCGFLSLILSWFFEETTIPQITAAIPTLLYGGALSVGIGYTLQVIAQRYTQPATAALFLSAEFLFAALAGALWLGERISPTQMLGAGLIFITIVAVQILPFLNIWLRAERS